MLFLNRLYSFFVNQQAAMAVTGFESCRGAAKPLILLGEIDGCFVFSERNPRGCLDFVPKRQIPW
jgi:hypothetical protein